MATQRRNPDGSQVKHNDQAKLDLSAAGIVRLARQRLNLFHAQSREPFASVWVRNHHETYRVKSQIFEEWLFGVCYQQHGFAPSQHAITSVIKVLAADAVFASERKPVSLRVGRHDGLIYVDLANDHWDVVQITPDGWKVLGNASVKFLRPPGMQALPYPEKGGQIADLRPFLNLGNEDAWILCVSWIMGALVPDGQFPPLILEGTHGSGKTTISRVLRSLVDPNIAPMRSLPRDTRDLRISASNAWCLNFDNLSALPNWLCDALCGLSTGGGFSTRELFTNDGEKIFEGRRPVLFNGIDIGIGRSDLLDRAISLSLPTIGDRVRETESGFWKRFNEVQPYVLGSLFDAVATALGRLPEVQPMNLPRMADFATWACAAAPALGWSEAAFLDAYSRNRQDSNCLALEASDLVHPIIRLADRGPWKGTATDLLSALVMEQLEDPPEVQRAYPTTARQLSQEIRRLAPSLGQLGIEIEFGRSAGTNSERVISIRKTCDAGDPATQRS